MKTKYKIGDEVLYKSEYETKPEKTRIAGIMGTTRYPIEHEMGWDRNNLGRTDPARIALENYWPKYHNKYWSVTMEELTKIEPTNSNGNFTNKGKEHNFKQ